MWRELAKERILRSIDAAQVILHITTAPNMPKNVYLEESIEQIISMTKFHLDNNVYPQFDPVYRAENKGTVQLAIYCLRAELNSHTNIFAPMCTVISGAHSANLIEQYTRTKVQHSDRSFIQN